MVIVYSEIITSRLEYVCQFIFETLLETKFKLTSSTKDFNSSSGKKINYSNLELESDIHILPHGIIGESDIKSQEIKTGEWNGLKTIFHSGSGMVPFDFLSATFYLISRYEEYLPHETDNHKRYLANQSILHKLEILETPIIDKWCAELAQILGINDQQKNYTFISTVDVDNAYAYRFKSFFIKCGSTIKAILKGEKEEMERRFGVYFNSKPDPYDTYDLISKVHESNNVKSIYFFLLSDRNEWDRNLPFSNKHLKALVSALQRRNTIGIHPGYLTYLDKTRTHEEKLRLEYLTDSEVKHSRQHFLKLKFPETFRNLSEIGIEHDYSLGYAEHLGFRAGTCSAFKFFDLKKNVVSNLTLHSSAIMDATLNRYLGMEPEEALLRAENIIKEVKEVKGELITIWHNETLSDIREWKGWRPVFEEMVSMAKSS